MNTLIDLTGKSFGRITVISIVKDSGPRYRWNCVCKCGATKTILGRSLRDGYTKSCGCWHDECKTVPMIGKKFGRLTVLERHNSPSSGIKYRCVCECGSEAFVLGGNLRHNSTKSCGCLHSEMASVRQRKRLLKEFGLSSKNRVLVTYQNHAKERGLVFNITPESFYDLISKPCFFCGTSNTNTSKSQHNNGDFSYNGLDRLNNSVGYTIDNVVPCCKHCNKAKLQMNVDDFEDWIRTVYWHFCVDRHFE